MLPTTSPTTPSVTFNQLYTQPFLTPMPQETALVLINTCFDDNRYTPIEKIKWLFYGPPLKKMAKPNRVLATLLAQASQRYTEVQLLAFVQAKDERGYHLGTFILRHFAAAPAYFQLLTHLAQQRSRAAIIIDLLQWQQQDQQSIVDYCLLKQNKQALQSYFRLLTTLITTLGEDLSASLLFNLLPLSLKDKNHWRTPDVATANAYLDFIRAVKERLKEKISLYNLLALLDDDNFSHPDKEHDSVRLIYQQLYAEEIIAYLSSRSVAIAPVEYAHLSRYKDWVKAYLLALPATASTRDLLNVCTTGGKPLYKYCQQSRGFSFGRRQIETETLQQLKKKLAGINALPLLIPTTPSAPSSSTSSSTTPVATSQLNSVFTSLNSKLEFQRRLETMQTINATLRSPIAASLQSIATIEAPSTTTVPIDSQSEQKPVEVTQEWPLQSRPTSNRSPDDVSASPTSPRAMTLKIDCGTDLELQQLLDMPLHERATSHEHAASVTRATPSKETLTSVITAETAAASSSSTTTAKFLSPTAKTRTAEQKKSPHASPTAALIAVNPPSPQTLITSPSPSKRKKRIHVAAITPPALGSSPTPSLAYMKAVQTMSTTPVPPSSKPNTPMPSQGHLRALSDSSMSLAAALSAAAVNTKPSP